MFCRHKGGHSLMTPPSVLDSIDIHHVELQHTPPKTATTPRREKHRSYWRKTSCEVPREMEKINLQTSGQLAAETAMTAVNPPRAKNEPHRVLPAGEAGRSHIYRARRKTLPGPLAPTARIDTNDYPAIEQTFLSRRIRSSGQERGLISSSMRSQGYPTRLRARKA